MKKMAKTTMNERIPSRRITYKWRGSNEPAINGW